MEEKPPADLNLVEEGEVNSMIHIHEWPPFPIGKFDDTLHEEIPPPSLQGIDC